MATLRQLAGGEVQARAMLAGTWWPSTGQAQLAGAAAIPAPGARRGGAARPALPRGGAPVRLGPAAAHAILQSLESAQERRQVDAALQRFGLDRNDPTHLLSARAYIWGRNMAPRRYWHVPYTGRVNERVAQAIGRFERDNPTTLGRAVNGDQAARAAIDEVVRAAVAGDGIFAPVLQRRRKSDVDKALSTDSAIARSIVKLQPGNRSWIAHHLLTFIGVARLPRGTQQAIAACGWRMDSAENLIALPANLAAYLANGQGLPWHAGGHPRYNAQVDAALSVIANTGATGDPLRALLLAEENAMRSYLFRVAPLGMLR